MSWIGALVVAASVMPALFFLRVPDISLYVPANDRLAKPMAAVSPLEIYLPLKSDFAALSIGASQDQISFSLDPVRPDRTRLSNQFLIRLKDSRQMKRVEMNPSVSVGLAYISPGALTFSEDASEFWLECRAKGGHSLEAALFYRTPEGDVIRQASWTPVLMETPVQAADEFPEGHPFRELAESKWWGADLLVQKMEPGHLIQRLEVGPASNSQVLDCQVGDWLTYRSKTWEKCDPPSLVKDDVSSYPPLAQVRFASSQCLEIEGWNEMSHVRLRLNPATTVPFKIKTEELFSQVRVRSEKQVSCMMDKQCLVLRPGDWVLKVGNRWKALKKSDEKEAFLKGNLSGELFILDKISLAPTAKSIVGCYFSAGRTQVATVEVAQKAQKSRKAGR